MQPARAVRILVFVPCLAVTQPAKPSFEVASIRPGSPGPIAIQGGTKVVGGLTGGPGTTEPERFTARDVPLRGYLLRAYGLIPFQLSGPGWIETVRFDITANVPNGANRDQFNLMLQNLLEERFKLKFHYEPKEFSGYELSVTKGGLKLKSSVPMQLSSPQSAIANAASKEGGGSTTRIPRPDGGWIALGKSVSMPSFASMLRGSLGGVPVVDATDLDDTYDFLLAYTPPDANPSDDSSFPTLFTALEKEFGLKLAPKKTTLKVMIIDHIESAPTEN